MNTQPAWLNKKLFPFESKWMEIDGNQFHYIDEGTGKTILFVHGTPEWSFGWRDLIKELRNHYRCIAIDLLLKNDKHYSGPAKVMNTFLGKMMYLKFNFPVNVVMPAAFGDKKKLTKEIHSHYKKALPNASSRVGAYAFAKELMNASDWWQSNWDQLDKISNKPFLLFWGMKDSFVPSKELEKWKAKLPSAKVVVYEDAGHFVQEEKAEEMAEEIRLFLKSVG